MKAVARKSLTAMVAAVSLFALTAGVALARKRLAG